MKEKLRDVFEHLSWPQAFTVIALAAIVALLAREIIPLIPPESWARIDWMHVIALLLGGGVATGGLALSPSLIRSRADRSSSSSTPAPRSSREGAAPIDVLGLVSVLLAFAAFAWAALRAWGAPILLVLGLGLSGCGERTPVAQQAAAIDVAAVTVAAAADAIALAADADVRSTCPEGSDPSCVDPVAERWAPVDAGVAAARAALGAWLAADRIAAAANTDPLTEALEEIGAFVRAYAALQHALAFAHVDIPPVPDIVCALVLGACDASSGGES